MGACDCRKVLRDDQEHAMVRHEAAEALGAIADPSSLQLLTQHCSDPEPIVADSCKVCHLLSDPVQWAACSAMSDSARTSWQTLIHFEVGGPPGK